MADTLLTLNAGSSSIKVALFELPTDHDALPKALWSGLADELGRGANARLRIKARDGRVLHDAALSGEEATQRGALKALLDWRATRTSENRGREDRSGEGPIRAVGHRVVHGGVGFTHPVLVDEKVLADLAALTPLAPLHQPHNVEGVRAAMAAFADVPQVACFDTAFHALQPEVNRRFAVPQKWHDKGVRRYGFHGLSYESIVAQLGLVDATLQKGRVVVAHLGNGASMCAIEGGRSVATTMSFSPLDGLTMGTRCGHIDAAVVLYLQRAHGLSADAIETLLFRESGLLGLSGLSSDMRELESSTLPASAAAIDHFAEQVVQNLGSLAAAMRGIDGIVFTGGIGENSKALRERVLHQAQWLGVTPDPQARGARLTAAGSRVGAWVLRTDEEAVIARHTARLLQDAAGANGPEA